MRPRYADLGALAFAATLGLTACSDSPSGVAAPATATVSITTPRGDDGAVIVTVVGPGFSNAQPASSFYRLYWRLVSDTELRVAVVGNVAPGPLFTVTLSDGRPSRYTATVSDAASRENQARESLTGYAATLATSQP